MKHIDITVYPEKKLGHIKPLNGVNNGPMSIYDGQKFLFDASSIFQEAEISRVRLHDVEYPYGGELFVDYECIFPIFEADADDPENYRFEETDRYLAAIFGSGAKILYRLGVSIEGSRVKRFISGPSNYDKFAEICEHIIAHYTQGWKRGFFYKDILWEIWNEPNGQTDMWTAGNKAYCEMYSIVAKHLKKKFPDELVGGPTVSYMTGIKWPNCALIVEEFKQTLKADPTIPIDFFSFHNYAITPEDVAINAKLARDLLDEAGRPNAFIVMDEYNYTNWGPDGQANISTQKGAAFLAANFVTMQSSPVEEACYYSAQVWPVFERRNRRIIRPLPGEYRSSWNGLYHVAENGQLETDPPYEAFLAFRDLRRLGTQIAVEASEEKPIYALAATDGKKYGAYLVNFSEEEVEVAFRGEVFVLAPYEILRKDW